MYKNCQRQEDYVEPAKSVMSEWLAGSLRDLPLSINKSHARTSDSRKETEKAISTTINDH